MNKSLSRVKEFLSYSPSGVASPGGTTFYETSDIPLAKVMELYEKDTTCKSSVDLLAEYADYRGLEAELMELREKYAEFSKKPPSVQPK